MEPHKATKAPRVTTPSFYPDFYRVFACSLLENRFSTLILRVFLYRLRRVVVASVVENPRPYIIGSMTGLERHGYEDGHNVRPILELWTFYIGFGGANDVECFFL